MSPTWRTRKMTLADLPAVMAIEDHSFAHPWSAEMVRKELSNDWSTVLLGESSAEGRWSLQGFVISWLIHDEFHILNVAVDPALRRKGIGRRILGSALEVARTQRCRNAYLEVRRSNAPAIGLYRSLGFAQAGVRPRYYSDNHEDALLMRLDLEADPTTALDTPP